MNLALYFTLGCCKEIHIHTDTSGIIEKGLLYPNIWEKKMIDTYTKRPFYELVSQDNRRYFLYWIGADKFTDTKDSWMVHKFLDAYVNIQMCITKYKSQ